jgi:hypothetical protein
MLIALALLTVAVFLVVVVGLTNTLRGMRRADGALLENAVLGGLREDIAALSLRIDKLESDIRTLRHNAGCSLHKLGAGPVFPWIEKDADVH